VGILRRRKATVVLFTSCRGEGGVKSHTQGPLGPAGERHQRLGTQAGLGEREEGPSPQMTGHSQYTLA
jgi:hypothetical protein